MRHGRPHLCAASWPGHIIIWPALPEPRRAWPRWHRLPRACWAPLRYRM